MTIEVRPAVAPATRVKTTADVLRHAARIIEERGWSQGGYEDEEGGVCALGAIYLASGIPEKEWGSGETPAEATMGQVVGCPEPGMRPIPYFNDAFGRTAAEVVAALRDAADAAEAA